MLMSEEMREIVDQNTIVVSVTRTSLKKIGRIREDYFIHGTRKIAVKDLIRYNRYVCTKIEDGIIYFELRCSFYNRSKDVYIKEVLNKLGFPNSYQRNLENIDHTKISC